MKMSEKPQVVFDSTALNGLRGLAALHILFFHSFYCSTWNINLLGAVRLNSCMNVKKKTFFLFFTMRNFVVQPKKQKRTKPI